MKYGIVPECDYDKIVDTVCLEIPADKRYLEKTELMILDMLANYDWDRPIYFMTQGGSLEIGIRNYLQLDGYTYKFVPIKSNTSLTNVSQVDTDALYDKLMNVFRLDRFADDFFVDYQNLSTFNGVQSHRFIFVQTALALYDKGEKEKAVQLLDRMQETFPDRNFPLNSSAAVHYVNEWMVLSAIELYIKCGEKEKGLDLADRFINETMDAIILFSKPFHGSVLSRSDLESNFQFYQYAVDIVNQADTEKAREYSKALEDLRSAPLSRPSTVKEPSGHALPTSSVSINEHELRLARSMTLMMPRSPGAAALNGSLISRMTTRIESGVRNTPSPLE